MNSLLTSAGGPAAFALILSIALFALKGIIKAAIETDFAKQLESLRADLRAKDGEISALRSTVMDGMARRHSVLAERRLQAIEAVWASVIEKAPLKMLAKMAERIKMAEFLKSSKTNPTSRKLGEALLAVGRVDQTLMAQNPALRLQLFVPPQIWAAYAAYSGILTLIALQAKMAAEGIGDELSSADSTIEIVRAALPHMSGFLDQFGENALPHLVQPLEDRILELSLAWLEGGEEDDAAVRRASKVASLARSAMTMLDEPVVAIPAELRAEPIGKPNLPADPKPPA